MSRLSSSKTSFYGELPMCKHDLLGSKGFLTHRVHVDEVASSLLTVLNPIEAIFRVDLVVFPGLTISGLIEEVVPGI